MDLLTIENLCMLAEATTVLLLIAFAWRPSKPVEDDSHESSNTTVNWETAKSAYLQSSIYRGLYLQKLGEANRLKSPGAEVPLPFHFRTSTGEWCESNAPEPWQDRLTKMLNRPGFDAILNAWNAIGPSYRSKSCLSMVSLSEYSQLVGSNGAQMVEQILLAISNHVLNSVSSDALIARYQPDRFALLHFSDSLGTCHRTMQRLHDEISALDFFERAGEQIPIACVCSIVDLADDGDCLNKMDELEEGYLGADENGDSVVSKSQGVWNKEPPQESPLAPPLEEITSNLHRNNSVMQANGLTNKQSDLNVELQSSSMLDAEAEGDDIGSSHDISAVANPDDIAALFAQINSEKASAAGLKKTLVTNPDETEQRPTLEPQATTSSDIASADDIAALFASTKPPPVKKPPVSPVPPAAPDALPVAQSDSRQAASAEDIAALFAAVKPKATSVEPNPPIQTTSSIQPPHVDLDAAATKDDIAALFATVKAGVQSKPQVRAVQSSEQIKVAELPAVKFPSVDQPDQVASADDIEALFAAMRK